MSLITRPPVVTIMGHVDHGKTSLLDRIRKSKVAAGEAGGITQHIGAYQAEHDGKKITFIDTPGHAAFSKMRSRGAAVTDIVILVVAANDGVKPQTIESIQHIKAAQVPVVVAINKSDLPEASPEMVKAQLTEYGINVTGYGGDVDAIEVSAKTGDGIDKLLETILVMAELEEFKADPDAELEGVVIEAVRDTKAGPVVTVLINQGTLKVRNEIFTPTTKAKVKRMTTATGQIVNEAIPSMPVEILGFMDVPNVGEMVTPSQPQLEELPEPTTPALPDMDFATLLGEAAPKLNIILKSDTVGTLQAIQQQLTEEVNVISAEVGDASESDVILAESTGAQIIGFNIRAPKSVQTLATEHGVRLKIYKIIYELLENLQKQVLKLIEPTIDEEVIGQAKVLQIFDMKGDKIAGVKITSGEIKKTDLIHVKRDDKIVGDPKIKSMQQGKNTIEKAKSGDECGIVFTRYTNFQVGDLITAYIKKDD